jgi:hypothetical protein
MRRGISSVAGSGVVRWARMCLRLSLAVVLGAGMLTVGTVTALRPTSARADEVTASQDNLRTGWDPNEPGLTPGRRRRELRAAFSTSVNGQVYAQPVVAGLTVIVATENDWVYGLNAATGAVNWSVSLGTPWPAASVGCRDLTPNFGVTGTPVYDPSNGTVYLVSQVVPPGSDSYHPAFYMHALNAQTGAEQPGWPVQIQGDPVNTPTHPFNAFSSLQRPGLLLMGGSVYAAFGGHCDFTPYVGTVAAVNTSTQALTMWADESGVTQTKAGIW